MIIGIFGSSKENRIKLLKQLHKNCRDNSIMVNFYKQSASLLDEEEVFKQILEMKFDGPFFLEEFVEGKQLLTIIKNKKNVVFISSILSRDILDLCSEFYVGKTNKSSDLYSLYFGDINPSENEFIHFKMDTTKDSIFI